MKIKYSNVLLFIFFVFPSLTYSQITLIPSIEEGGEYPIERNNASKPCITPEQYKIIKKQCLDNIKLLGLQNVGKNNTKTTLLSWPLRTANGLNDCSYYYIGNYVDQDTTSPGIRDWNCGSVSYDGHQGTDLCTFPYPFEKMDNNEVEVIAAAPGTIVNRVDGHYDRNCAMTDSTANYIVIQHADGSCALYWHMKKNSLSSKILGQTVVTGEYLGVVGSSGSSTGPHLHFEVLSGITLNTLNDPFAGSCNLLNANSWWVVQKPYTEPAIIQTSVHPALAVFSPCPATEIPNEDSCYTAGGSARFYVFFRNETSGLVTNMRIINPDETTFTSWTHSSNLSHLNSYWISTKTLPTNAGTYTFEATYNGIICSKTFKINCNLSVNNTSSNLSRFIVFPNPCIGGKFTFEIQTTDKLKNGIIEIFDVFGNNVYQTKITGEITEINPNVQSGIYFYKLKDKQQSISSGKLIIY
jgi:murein DD-endopeptidase MepM/ murein hydrolase activator NlpD